MSRIRAIDTSPEVAFRRRLWSLGYRYRKNYTSLAGKPDIVFVKQKVAVFIDGEFWHGFNWKEKRDRIKSNREYWVSKIERNIQRDNMVTRSLEDQGWKVIRYWMHQLKKQPDECLRMVVDAIRQ